MYCIFPNWVYSIRWIYFLKCTWSVEVSCKYLHHIKKMPSKAFLYVAEVSHIWLLFCIWTTTRRKHYPLLILWAGQQSAITAGGSLVTTLTLNLCGNDVYVDVAQVVRPGVRQLPLNHTFPGWQKVHPISVALTAEAVQRKFCFPVK